MTDFAIVPSKLKGSLSIPPSKSQTLRAILFAALASGSSLIQNALYSPDTEAMIQAVRAIGAEVKKTGEGLEIVGVGGKPKIPDDVIACGNSGIVLRFMTALSGLNRGYTVLTGDHSIRYQRPMKALLDGMHQLGAFAVSTRENGFAPLIIKGPFTHHSAIIDGKDSQPVSGLLIASAFASHPIELNVTSPGEKPWVLLTLDWFKKLKIPYSSRNYHYYSLIGSSRIDGFSYSVPGDFSSAAFPIAAALITNSELTLDNLDIHDVQGDKAVISILQKMGARISVDASTKRVVVQEGGALKGIKIDINDCIDALPILAVIGCFAEGTTEIVNGAVARQKESDRISSIATELSKMGAKIRETPDGLIIYQSRLLGAEMEAHADHRLALSLAVAGLGASGSSLVRGGECVAKTYPTFCHDFASIGAEIERIEVGQLIQ